MDDTNDEDEMFLDAVDHIVLEGLAAIGADPRARFSFFRRLLAVAIEATGRDARRRTG